MLLAIQVIWLMFGLVVKHFICDFMLQTKFQYSNKHIFGHPGGLLHALIHVLGTMLVGWIVVPDYFVLIALMGCVEGIVHYFIDWAKMNINIQYGWTAVTHSQFWILTGLDQMLHYLCYVAMLIVLV